MPSISQIKQIVTETLQKSPTSVFYIVGKPGMGKSDMCYQVGTDLGIPKDRVMAINVLNYDVVDFTGVPEIVEKSDVRCTTFAPTDLFYQFREGTGPGLIVIEELAQSTHHHQTWFAGFSLDRKTPTYRLDPQVRVIATGNRLEDKAGARQLLSHLNNRMYILEMETSLDDWCEWAMDHGIDPLGIAFLRLRPGLLNDFDPDRKSNPTQRSWTQLFMEVPTTLPTSLYLYAAQGKVGEGAGADWVAARDMMTKMPSIDVVRMHPERTEVPKEPAVQYAIATALSMTATVDSFDRDMLYVSRMPKDLQMVYVTDVINLLPKLQQTKPFIDWAIKNKDIFMGGE
jgi:hypothetical protein